MGLFFKSEYEKKTEYYMTTGEKIIDKAISIYPNLPSCKDDLLSEMKKTIKYSSKEDFKSLSYEEIEYSAYSHLFQYSSDLLISGKYNIYTGVLNPMSCAKQLEWIMRNSLDYAVAHGTITEEVKNEQLRNIYDAISTVG